MEPEAIQRKPLPTAHRYRLKWCAAASLLMLQGCVTQERVHQAGSSFAQNFTQAAQEAKPTAETRAPASAPTAAATVAGLRSAASLQALFAKRSATGTELMLELAAVRKLMQGGLTGAAIAALVGPAPSAEQASGGSSFDLRAMAFAAALKVAEEQIKPYLSSIGFGAFELHMKAMLDDPKLLQAETVELPDPKGMSIAQMQRVVNMAAILAATRVSSKILAKAVEDFANVEADYLKLIGQREKTAELLFGVLTANTGSQGRMNAIFKEDDLRYLRENVSRMSIKAFSNDLGAQNLALRYLQQTDSKAWEAYDAMSDGLRRTTIGYIRTVAGVTAFAGLVASFGNETIGQVNKNRAIDIFQAVPLGWEFTKEVPPFLTLAWKAGAAGVVELPMVKGTKRFRFLDSTGTADLGRADEVFKGLKDKGAEPTFNDALFRNGADGLLYKLYRCNRSEVGRMLDVAVPLSEREKFANKVFPAQATRFSFANLFNDAQGREFAEELLRSDHRDRSSARQGVAMGEVQRAAVAGASKWNNDQLLRLILANREGAAAHASLQVDQITVRLVPSMQSVYAYETLIEECSAQFGGGPRVVNNPTPAPARATTTPPRAPTAAPPRPTRPAPAPAPAPGTQRPNRQ